MTLKIYKFINADSGSDDKRVKVSGDDTAPGFLEDKISVAETTNISDILETVTLSPGSNENFQIGIDETLIDHDVLTNWVLNKHIDHSTVDIATGVDSGLKGGGDITTTRNIEVDIDGTTEETIIANDDFLLIEDTSVGAKRKMTRLNFLDGYIQSSTKPVTTRTIPVYDGTTGNFVIETGVTIDASDNMVIPGNLQVDGTQTIFNTEVLDVEDANISVNVNGNQSVANTNVAGLTVTMTDATDARFGYDSSTTSKFKLGEVGSEAEVATISHSQILTNKTMDFTSATGTNTISADASDIVFDNTTSGLTATDTQAAVDEVEGRLDTVETTLADHLNGGASKHDATEIDYERVDGSKKNIDAASDDAEAALSDLDDAIGALSTPTNYTAADDTIVADHLDGIDTEIASIYSAIDLKQDDVITTEGDLVVGDGSGEESRLPIGADTYVLTSNGTTAQWQPNTDEQVKVSANDTTTKYLEDCITVSSGTNTTNILETSTLNDGADEDFQIQIDETKIDHDQLTNFEADEHIDNTTVTIAGGEGLTGSGDLTSDVTIDMDINGLTTETSIETTDLIVFYDVDAAEHKNITQSNLLGGYLRRSAGDIDETSFSLANNQSSPTNVTGLSFNNAVVRSFEAQVSVVIDATADLYEVFTLQGIQKGSQWDISSSSTGDTSGINFTITAGGQVQYTSDNYAGFSSGTMKFRALTTSV
jgi:hypothetical protein